MTLTYSAEPTFDELPEYEDEPRRRLSILRLLVAMVVLGASGWGVFLLVRNRIQDIGTVRGTWFAPYVDLTLTPTSQFQIPANNVARQSVLSFVVADAGTSCTPSWGGVYTLAAADQSLNLASRLAQLRSEGAFPIVSFGGQKNQSLQVACSDQSALNAAFASVVNRYGLKTIDLDVEGAALNDFAANRRLATALVALEANHPQLAVWLTIPVEPSGLQDNARSLVSTLLRARVALAGVNVLAMDFNDGSPNLNMLSAVEAALSSAHQQLAGLYGSFGTHLHSKVLWNHMGATVMVGQNNQANQVFTIANANGLDTFARQTGLGRISLWSLNRDAQCGAAFAVSGVLSDTCSGVAEANLGFSRVFARFGGTVVLPGSGRSPLFTLRPDLNPADSPYPQWSGQVPYIDGYKVVRQGFIYEAKWYTQGFDPATPVQFEYQTPWAMIGPVLPGSHPRPLPTLPAGTYPEWAVNQNYPTGSKVLLNGLPYEARWDTEGASPAAEAADPADSPWTPLFTIPGEPANRG